MSIPLRRSPAGRALPLALALVLFGPMNARAVTLDPVIVEPRRQHVAFGNGAWFTWTTDTRFGSKVLAQRSDGTGRVRLNAPHTDGWGGGLDPDEDVAIYQQTNRSNRSDIYLYDLGTGTSAKAPFVNTRQWESSPRISNTWILFTRELPRNGHWYMDMWAVRRSDGAAQRVGSWREGRNILVRTGTIGEQWATWTICRSSTCRAYARNLLAEETTLIPVQGEWSYYAPAVDEGNDRVYFVRGRTNRCGDRAQLRALPLSDLTGTSTLVRDLPDHFDVAWEASVAPNLDTGMNDYLFARWRCRANDYNDDIWKVSDVSTIPT